MTQQDSNETGASQAEGEGPDGSDKPPRPATINTSRPPNGTHMNPQSPISPTTNGTMKRSGGRSAVPLHAREAESHLKEPQILTGALPRGIPGQFHSSPSTTSLSSSDHESWSPPSSKAPSRRSSRAPSFNAGKLNMLLSPKKHTPPAPQPAGAEPPSTPRSKAPSSVHSDSGHKFTLKELLATAPKLGRKSSVRSAGSSKKSESDGGAKSVAESTSTLLRKYGVCENGAIGKGATSVVRLVHKWDRAEEKIYAVKEFRKRRKNETEKEYVKKLTAEFCISSTLHHVNIVETVDLVQDESQRWCEVMEFCPGGDLYAAIKRGRMSPSEVECCFKQILTGVTYLHSQGVAHRDIKPENLFFDLKGHLKIGDYGASTVYRLPWESTVHMSTGLCGSEPYIAPEQFVGKPYDARLVDIWACGVVYYCLHFQEMPWRVAQTSDSLYAAYANACNSSNAAVAATPPTIANLSPKQCRPLIRAMLEPNPKSRWTTEQIMEHPWMQGIEVCHLMEKPKHVHVNIRSIAGSHAN